MKNKNKCIVKVKKDRVCKICGKKIKTGTHCITINPRHKPRYWICIKHANNNDVENKCHCYDQINHLKTILANDYDFDDEGKYYALVDVLTELQEENCDKCNKECDLREVY